MAEEIPGATWGERMILRTASRVRAARLANGWSVRQLADRTEQLGHPVGRQALVNLESGRRGSLSVDDLWIIAHALEVNPLFLLYDPRDMGRRTEVLPGVEVPEWEAFRWASSRSGVISSVLYGNDFDDARSIVQARERLDDLRGEVRKLLFDLAQVRQLDPSPDRDAQETGLQILLHEKRARENAFEVFLTGDGVDRDAVWFSPHSLAEYIAGPWGEEPTEGTDGDR